MFSLKHFSRKLSVVVSFTMVTDFLFVPMLVHPQRSVHCYAHQSRVYPVIIQDIVWCKVYKISIFFAIYILFYIKNISTPFRMHHSLSLFLLKNYTHLNVLKDFHWLVCVWNRKKKNIWINMYTLSSSHVWDLPIWGTSVSKSTGIQCQGKDLILSLGI